MRKTPPIRPFILELFTVAFISPGAITSVKYFIMPLTRKQEPRVDRM
jgi:hypothetical protein